MAELDIFEEAPQRYFDFMDDSEVLIEFQGKDVLSKIQVKAAEVAKKIGEKDVSKIFNRILGKKAVKHWRKKADHTHPGLMLKGEPLPCTPANIDYLMTHSTDFTVLVNQRCVDAAAFRDGIAVDIDAITDELFGTDLDSGKGKADDSKNG